MIEFFRKLSIHTAMDISIRTVSEVSAISEKAFVPGDRVWSLLFRDPDGVVERMDVLPDELEQVNLEGGILCKWSQLIKEHESTEAELRRAALQSTEEVFLSLYEEEEVESEEESVKETRERLKFFLSIQLERKRVLKPAGGQNYRHVASKRIYKVPRL